MINSLLRFGFLLQNMLSTFERGNTLQAETGQYVSREFVKFKEKIIKF